MQSFESGFILAVIVAAIIVYAPGYCSLRAVRTPREIALAAAPLPTLFLYPLLGTAFATFSASVEWYALFAGALVVVGLWCLICRIYFHRQSGAGKTICLLPAGRMPKRFPDIAFFALPAIVGVVLGWIVFSSNLYSFDAFCQEYDNAYHLSLIRTLTETGAWSPFSASIYAIPQDNGFNPFGDYAAFYPASWHILCALTACASNTEITVAVNAVNFLLSFIVYPAGVTLFLREVFFPAEKVALFGSVLSLCIVAFPWMYLGFGPLYPNLLGNALVYPTAFAFVVIWRHGASTFHRLFTAGLFASGLIAIALAQPNGAFALVILLAPFCVSQISARACELRSARKHPCIVGTLAGGVAFAVIAIIWLAFYNAPFMHAVVSSSWPATLKIHDAILSALTISFGESFPSPPHIVVGILALSGVFFAVSDKHTRWTVFPYAFTVLALVVNASTDGTLKQILTGFWYNDPRRMVALIGMFSVPLASLALERAAYGISFLIDFSSNRLQSNRAPWSLKPASLAPLTAAAANPSLKKDGYHYCSALGIMLCAIAVAFSTSIPLPSPSGTSLTPPLQVTGAWIERQSDISDETIHVLTAKERDFAERAQNSIPPGEPIVNVPNDGSGFLFGACGVKTVYRYLSGYGASERPESKLIRTSLYHISEQNNVKQAIKAMGVRYVLLLDQGNQHEEERHYLFSKDADDWSGIESICDETPGFSIVLAEGDMRLYRINL